MSAFPEYGNDYSFSTFEQKVLDFWRREKIFERSLEKAKDRPTYYFYDGPPFATGLPHYGHILAGTIKDIVPRYWSMRGYRVPRRFGWDTHGLPVEYEMEKTLGLSGSLEIQDYGVAKFNEACRGIVFRYASEWRKTVERMGRWIDMDHDYKTLDSSFMETVWWVFKKLWEKGLIYEGKKVVPYSWRLTAPLSNFEASQNYKDVQDPALSVLFAVNASAKHPEWVGNTALAVWTTTPWTLPSNLALAVHTDPTVVPYARFKLPQAVGRFTHVILAEPRAEIYGLQEKVESLSGAELLGTTYEPLFSTYLDEERKADRAFRVVDGSSFVSATDGTGIVHLAPSFGEDDYYTCLREKIRPVDPTDMQANFTVEIARDERLKPIVGQFVKDADKHIIKVLKDAGHVWRHETINHAYPFCERSDTPLIYKAISSWFVKVEAIKDQMLQHNQSLHWVPGHIQQGRFGKWLENARDWCISRNRFWGTPIPVWRCTQCKHVQVVGSRAELDAMAGHHLEDLHSHHVDHVQPVCTQCQSGKMQRTPEVLDCWFESGAMPYAQEHYPFENKERFEKSFPADFIAEGIDQTRGWFYTLTVLSTALFDKPAFKNCIVNGMVLAEDGKKMSKRLKNYPDPHEIFEKYGADALRLYLMQSPAMHAEELRFSERQLVELMRAVMLPLWNAYGFFASYANIDGWKGGSASSAAQTRLDRWILARAQQTLLEVHASMERYQLAEVAPTLINYIDDLTNWYIRLSRDRFWSEGASPEKNAAYATLWSALETLSKTLAPFLPFMAEVLHAALHGRHVDQLKEASVHEGSLPDPRALKLSPDAEKLVAEIALAKKVILLGRSLRGEAKIGLRQPLQKLRVAGLGAAEKAASESLRDLILKEVNVKELELVDRASDLVEESAKPNHRVLGKKVGGAMKDIQAALAQWSSAEIQAFEKSCVAEVKGHRLTREDIQVTRKARPGRLAQADYGLVAELDTALSEELVREGLQRQIINRVQQLRKERRLHLADRIRLRWQAPSGSLVQQILEAEKSGPGLIGGETLAREVVFTDSLNGAQVEDFGEQGRLLFDIEKI